MLTTETMFVDGRPVGRIVIETCSQEVAFVPTVTPSKLPLQDWDSIDELRSTVIAVYQTKGNDEETKEAKV